MGDIVLLTLAPHWFRYDVRVCATLNHVRHSVPESLPDIFNASTSTGVFAGVMKQCPYSFIFVCAIFQRNTRDTEQVRHVRDLSSLPDLAGMNQYGVNKGLLKPLRQMHMYQTLPLCPTSVTPRLVRERSGI